MRVATYTRISTDEDHQPFSLGAQQERLLAYSGVQEGWQVVRQFTDQTSGATLERPGLKTALEEAATATGPRSVPPTGYRGSCWRIRSSISWRRSTGTAI